MYLSGLSHKVVINPHGRDNVEIGSLPEDQSGLRLSGKISPLYNGI